MAEVILSGFADEGPVSKRAEEQFTMMRALGLSYYTIRFIDVGNGVKNVMELTAQEIQTLQKLHREFGIAVSSIGSPARQSEVARCGGWNGQSLCAV